jgi:hypothetical protein
MWLYHFLLWVHETSNVNHKHIVLQCFDNIQQYEIVLTTKMIVATKTSPAPLTLLGDTSDSRLRLFFGAT